MAIAKHNPAPRPHEPQPPDDLPTIPRSDLSIMLERLWAWPLVAALATAFFITTSRAVTVAYVEPDPSGYLQMARSFSQGTLGRVADDPFLYQEHIWVQTASGQVACKFAPGYPILLAFVRAIFGEGAVFLLNPILGSLALVGAFSLFRLWMSSLAALLASVALASGIFFSFYMTFPLTHAADVCFVTWGMFFLWKWSHTPPDGGDDSHGTAYAAAAGLVLGFAVLIRPMNALLALPVAIALAAQLWTAWRTDATPWKPLAALIACYAVFPALLMYFNYHVFGHSFAAITGGGYALCGESAAFATENFPHRMPRYLAAMRDYVGLPFLLGAAGLLLRGSARDRLMRFSWAVPLLALHMFYYWDQPAFHWNIRLLLSSLVVYYGAAFALLDHDARPWFKSLVLIAFCAAVVALDRGVASQAPARNVVPFLWDQALVDAREKETAGANVLVDTLPLDAVVFADAPACHYLASRNQLVVYDLRAFDRAYSEKRWLKPTRKPDWDPKHQPERTQAIAGLYTGRTQADLTKIKREKIASLMKAGEKVRLVLAPGRVEQERAELGDQFTLGKVVIKGETPLEIYAVLAREK